MNDAVYQNPVAYLDQAIGGPFGQHQVIGLSLVSGGGKNRVQGSALGRRRQGVNGGHAFALGIKRQFANTRQYGLQIALHQSRLLGRKHQSAFGGIAENPAWRIFVDDGIVAQRPGQQQQAEVGIIAVFRRRFIQVIAALRQHHVRYGHFILRQRAGFVGTNHGHAAQGFHRRKLADDCVLLQHLLRAQGQGDGDDSRQAFGDGRHRHADGGHEHLFQARALQINHAGHDDDQHPCGHGQ